MVNQSKIRDPRYLRKWLKSGATGTLTFDIRKHPEVRSGEIFLTNSNPHEYHCISWLTKRRGIQPLDSIGRPIELRNAGLNFFPVFVQENELVQGGIQISFLCLRRAIPFYPPFRSLL